MSRAYTVGRYARGICDRCGLEYKLNDLKKEWTGLKVCHNCYDYYPEQLHVRAVSDPQALRDPRPEETSQGGKDADLQSAVNSIFGGVSAPYFTGGAGMFGESG